MEKDGAVLIDWQYAIDIPIRYIRMENSGVCVTGGETKTYSKGQEICFINDPFNKMVKFMRRLTLLN